MSEAHVEHPAFLAAARRVAGLRGALGDDALRLAYHAAVPVVVDAALLNLLRVNFFLDPPDDLPYEIEAELLLSPLFREIGEGLYEIEPGLRNLLLSGLHDRYGSDRVRRVAALLEQYTNASGAWRALPELEMAQQLTALSFHDPARAAAWLAANEVGALSSRVPGGPPRDWYVAMRGRIEEQPTVTTVSHELRSALDRLDVTKDAETRLAVVADIGVLARLPEADVDMVVPALCQFIEAWDTLTPGRAKRVSPDVQVALTILGSVGRDIFRAPIRLNNVVLRGANLVGLDFSNTDFNRVTLTELNARGINLSNARFRDVVLESAVLDSAHLEKASLEFSALRHVSLSGFSGTSVYVAAATVQDVTAISLNGTRLHILPLRVPEDAVATDAIPPGSSGSRVDDLIQRGRSQGHLSLSDLRIAFEQAGLTPAEARSILRELSEAGVRLGDEEREFRPPRPARKATAGRAPSTETAQRFAEHLRELRRRAGTPAVLDAGGAQQPQTAAYDY